MDTITGMLTDQNGHELRIGTIVNIEHGPNDIEETYMDLTSGNYLVPKCNRYTPYEDCKHRVTFVKHDSKKNFLIRNFYNTPYGYAVSTISQDKDKLFESYYLISDIAVSRHPSKENMEACIKQELSYSRNAFFFIGTRAAYEINRNLLNAINLDDKLKTRLEELRDVFITK